MSKSVIIVSQAAFSSQFQSLHQRQRPAKATRNFVRHYVQDRSTEYCRLHLKNCLHKILPLFKQFFIIIGETLVSIPYPGNHFDAIQQIDFSYWQLFFDAIQHFLHQFVPVMDFQTPYDPHIHWLKQ